MKNTIFLLIALFTLSACPSAVKQKVHGQLQGKWIMTSYVAFMPAIPELKDGDITWDFDGGKSVVAITKKDSESHSFIGPNSGHYPYTLKGKTIIINSSDYFYSFEDGKLRLDSNTTPGMSKDGPIISFKRN